MIGKLIKVATVATLGMSSMALADGFLRMSDATGGFNGLNGSGGAFVANTAAPGGFIGQFGGPNASTTSFLTFCIERNENVTLGNPNSGNNNLYYGKIATGAVNGGISGGNPDPVSSATALLYSSFRKGLPIASYPVDGSSGVVAYSQNLQASGLVSALQFAIWYLEGEFNNNPGGVTSATSASFPGQNIGSGALNTAYKNVAADMVNWALANANGSLYNVRVLQIWGYDGSGSRTDASNYTVNVQDQLTLIPLPPAAFAGAGLMGLVAFRAIRRRRAVQSI